MARKIIIIAMTIATVFCTIAIPAMASTIKTPQETYTHPYGLSGAYVYAGTYSEEELVVIDIPGLAYKEGVQREYLEITSTDLDFGPTAIVKEIYSTGKARYLFEDLTYDGTINTHLENFAYNQRLSLEQAQNIVPYWAWTQGSTNTLTITYTIRYTAFVRDSETGITEATTRQDEFTKTREITEGQIVNVPLFPAYGADSAILYTWESLPTLPTYVNVESLDIKIEGLYTQDGELRLYGAMVGYNELVPNENMVYNEIAPLLGSVEQIPEEAQRNFVGWIITALQGFFNFEIVPGIKVWYIIGIPITAFVVHAFLKIFAGG